MFCSKGQATESTLQQTAKALLTTYKPLCFHTKPLSQRTLHCCTKLFRYNSMVGWFFPNQMLERMTFLNLWKAGSLFIISWRGQREQFLLLKTGHSSVLNVKEMLGLPRTENFLHRFLYTSPSHMSENILLRLSNRVVKKLRSVKLSRTLLNCKANESVKKQQQQQHSCHIFYIKQLLIDLAFLLVAIGLLRQFNRTS